MVRPNRIFLDIAQTKTELFGLEIFSGKNCNKKGRIFFKKGTNLENICVEIVCFLKAFAVQNRTWANLRKKQPSNFIETFERENYWQ